MKTKTLRQEIGDPLLDERTREKAQRELRRRRKLERKRRKQERKN